MPRTPPPASPSAAQTTRPDNGGVLRDFRQVDVFTTVAYYGNPVAVVLDGSGLNTEQMQRFAHWMNLSETTFVLPPDDAAADYRVRIFTPVAELPFAGHPTLGTCHAWLETGGVSKVGDVVVQQCGAGLVPIRQTVDGLAFAAPPLVREGPVEEVLLSHIADVLRIDRGEIVDAEWVDNGPGWVAVMLASAEAVLAVRPGFVDLDVGVVGAYPPHSPEAFEVRAFFPKNGTTVEDPVTGSLNASLASWLLRTGRAEAPYVARQGTALGRAGRVHVSRDSEGHVPPRGGHFTPRRGGAAQHNGRIWVGGGTVTCVTGKVDI